MKTKFEIWLDNVNKIRKNEWDSKFTHREYIPLTYSKGRSFVKILDNDAVWGFVSMKDGVHKNAPVKIGDLLMPASYSSPAKHSRGNILDNTANWDYYGPKYLT